MTTLPQYLRRTLDSAEAGVFPARGVLLLRVTTGVLILYIHGRHEVHEGIAYLRDGASWRLVEEIAGMGMSAPASAALVATAVQLVSAPSRAIGLFTRLNATLLTGVPAMITALRFTRHSPVIQAVLVRTAGFAFFGIAPVALLPLIVRSRQLAAADFGALMGAYGVGGIVAAFALLPVLRRRFSSDTILLGATLLFAVLAATLTVVDHRIPMGAALFFAGASWLIAVSTLAVAGQSAFPDWVRARSSAIYLIAFQAALAIGALTWGATTTHFDAATDGLYGPGVNLVRSGQAGKARYIGSQAALKAEWSPTRNWRLHVVYSRFVAGDFIRESGPGDDVDYASASVIRLF